eukprot:gene503-8681_t
MTWDAAKGVLFSVMGGSIFYTKPFPGSAELAALRTHLRMKPRGGVVTDGGPPAKKPRTDGGG